jgi:hypothetical protein
MQNVKLKVREREDSNIEQEKGPYQEQTKGKFDCKT